MRGIYIILGLVLTGVFVFAQFGDRQEKSTNHHQTRSFMAQTITDSEAGFTEADQVFFEHCLRLAEDALIAGDQPFGSILVNKENEIIAEARNRVNEKNMLAHPEIELAEWAMNNLSLEERRQTIMYTTGEHCPMCAGAHSWSQIGGLYYLSSAAQLGEWLNEFGVEAAPISFIPAEVIMKNVVVKGPAKGPMLEEIKGKHKRYYKK